MTDLNSYCITGEESSLKVLFHWKVFNAYCIAESSYLQCCQGTQSVNAQILLCMHSSEEENKWKYCGEAVKIVLWKTQASVVTWEICHGTEEEVSKLSLQGTNRKRKKEWQITVVTRKQHRILEIYTRPEERENKGDMLPYVWILYWGLMLIS